MASASLNITQLQAEIDPLDLERAPAFAAATQSYCAHYGLDFDADYPGLQHHIGRLACEPFDLVCQYFSLPEARGCCYIVHGYFDHTGLYRHLIEFCLQHSLSVVMFDLPGHGLSTGGRAAIDEFCQYRQALQTVLDYFGPRVSLPRYAIGQSTGGAIWMDYLLQNPEAEFAGVALLAPLYRPTAWPRRRITYELGRWFTDRVPRRFEKNSNDEDFLRFLKHGDPLQPRHLSVVWVGAMKRWMARFLDYVPSRRPLLIVQGRKDNTVDWRFNLPLIEQKFPSATVVYLDDGHHQLVNESAPLRAEMFTQISKYLDLPR